MQHVPRSQRVDDGSPGHRHAATGPRRPPLQGFATVADRDESGPELQQPRRRQAVGMAVIGAADHGGGEAVDLVKDRLVRPGVHHHVDARRRSTLNGRQGEVGVVSVDQHDVNPSQLRRHDRLEHRSPARPAHHGPVAGYRVHQGGRNRELEAGRCGIHHLDPGTGEIRPDGIGGHPRSQGGQQGSLTTQRGERDGGHSGRPACGQPRLAGGGLLVRSWQSIDQRDDVERRQPNEQSHRLGRQRHRAPFHDSALGQRPTTTRCATARASGLRECPTAVPRGLHRCDEGSLDAVVLELAERGCGRPARRGDALPKHRGVFAALGQQLG